MRAVAVAADRSLVTVERPQAQPAAGQVLIEIAYCGICGSDLHFRDVPELFPEGTIPGHEMSGRVVGLGGGVPSWLLGERVTVLPFGQCGECELCRSGREQVCPHAIPNGVGLGTGRPGGYAEHVVVDERMLFKLPDSVDDRAGALTEPLAVAVRAVERAALARDAPAMILGAGTIGGASRSSGSSAMPTRTISPAGPTSSTASRAAAGVPAHSKTQAGAIRAAAEASSSATA